LGVLGLIGILVCCAGAHLLWQGRREILFWLAEFFRILRGEFTRRDAGGAVAVGLGEADTAVAPALVKRNPGTLRLVTGLALLFLGQALLLLDLVFLG
jgi:hypothetical protein